MYVPQHHKILVGFVEREGHILPGQIAWVFSLRLGYRVA